MRVHDTHMCAIQTKFLGPTNHRGARIKVWRADGVAADDPDALTVSWGYELNPSDNHAAAIDAYLAAKAERGHDWCERGHWTIGGTRYGAVAVFVGKERDVVMDPDATYALMCDESNDLDERAVAATDLLAWAAAGGYESESPLISRAVREECVAMIFAALDRLAELEEEA